MSKQESRGSTDLWKNVFQEEAPKQGALAAAITAAREDYTIRRWWKYGQPAIDVIKATLEVKIENTGKVIQDLVSVHGEEIQVTVDVFPIGIPVPDLAQLNVVFERQIG